MKELQLEALVNGQRRQNGSEVGGRESSARPQVASIKALKLPPYSEQKDDLNAYLSRFERAGHACSVQPER